jgi:proteasome accessory factor C
MIPLIRARPGIRIPELASIFGVREEEIWDDITEVLTLCGVPPYLPHNYLVFSIHHDEVTISFAEHLSRPVHLTLQEALAIDLALRTVSGGRPPVFADAAPRLRGKLRELLGGSDRKALESLDRGVGGTAPPDLVTETIRLLKDAMARNLCVEVEYYTGSRDAVSRRTMEPYGLIDHRGTWYVVARDRLRGMVLPFRVDRIRGARIVPAEEYEVPEDFTTETYRRDDMWTEGPEDIEVKVAFSAAAAPRVREEAQRRELRDLPDGGVVRTFRIQRSRPRWLYTHVLRYGADAEILGPKDVRRGMGAFLDRVLEANAGAFGEGGGASVSEVGASTRGRVVPAPTSRATTTAAARARPNRTRTKKKPPARDA